MKTSVNLLRKTYLQSLVARLSKESNPQVFLGVVKREFPKVYEYVEDFKNAHRLNFITALYIFYHPSVNCVCENPGCSNYPALLSWYKGPCRTCSNVCAGESKSKTNYPKTTKPLLPPRHLSDIEDHAKKLLGTNLHTFQKWLRSKYPKVDEYCGYESSVLGIKSTQVLYNILCDSIGETYGHCEHCSSPTCPFISFNQGYKKFCSNSCMGSSDEIKKKKIATNLRNNGVEFPQQSRKIRRKKERTVLKLYGSTNVSSVEEFKKNRDATMLKRYGAVNAMGNAELRHKASTNSYSSRGHLRYYFKLGSRIVELRGFEPQALSWILANTPTRPNDIVVDLEKKVPSISYTHRNKRRTYYPDFYIISLKEIVEVKAVYPLLTSTESWRNLKRKRLAVIAAGFSFTLLVMTEKGHRVPIPKDWHSMSRAAAAKAARP